MQSRFPLFYFCCLLQYEDAFWSDRISRWELPHPYKEVKTTDIKIITTEIK